MRDVNNARFIFSITRLASRCAFGPNLMANTWSLMANTWSVCLSHTGRATDKTYYTSASLPTCDCPVGHRGSMYDEGPAEYSQNIHRQSSIQHPYGPTDCDENYVVLSTHNHLRARSRGGRGSSLLQRACRWTGVKPRSNKLPHRAHHPCLAGILTAWNRWRKI